MLPLSGVPTGNRLGYSMQRGTRSKGWSHTGISVPSRPACVFLGRRIAIGSLSVDGAGDIMGEGVPDDIQFHISIAMNEGIAHRLHVDPGNGGILSLELCCNTAADFPK